MGALQASTELSRYLSGDMAVGNYIVQESNRGKMDHRVEERVEFCPPMKGLSDKDM